MIRLLVSDVLNGACFAALIVLAAGQSPKISAGSAVPARDVIERSQSLGQSSAERGSQPAERDRDIAGAEGTDRASAAIETQSMVAGDNPQKSDAVSLSRLPSFMRPELKAAGGLGPAANGGIDAHVPPIVRQRPVTPPLKTEAKPKGKEKVKAAASAKSKSDAKQASRTVTPASVKR
ncbi:MAG: hypothetical protein ACKVP3_00695 [Hyphomicrobiaceae bacterium]